MIETDGAGNFQYRYIFFNGMRVSREEANDSVDHYGLDALGNVRFVYGHNGSWDVSDYYPFGGERVLQSQTGNTYKFTGKERDSESGLDNFGARFDSSSFGRFMSPDWAGYPEAVPYAELTDPRSLNLYSYTQNNPLNMVDYDGHDDIPNPAAKCGLLCRIATFIASLFYSPLSPDQSARQEHIQSPLPSNRGGTLVWNDPEAERAAIGRMITGGRQITLPTPGQNTIGPPNGIIPLPMNVIRALQLIDALGSALPGTKGGAGFNNDGRGGGEVLPRTDAEGNPIAYKEWDVNPPGSGGRDAERIVTGSDGSAYYTGDHYKTFKKIR